MEIKMYPYKILLGMSLYDICFCLGIIACFFVFGYLADKQGIKRKTQNFAMLCGLGAIALGYGSAILFQALYNIKTQGGFEIGENTGTTFYGGLIGGVLSFLIMYFGVGYFKYDDKYHIHVFFRMADSAVPAIVVAHSLGRVGCLMAGCCHGALTDEWYGIMMHGGQGYAKYVPVQLFEAVFLMLLFGFLFIRSIEKRGYCLPTYLCVYSIWRFAVEYIRGDYRGSIFTDLLTPSQFISCILFVIGIGVIFLEKSLKPRLEAIGGGIVEDMTEAETGSESNFENEGGSDVENETENGDEEAE